MSLGLLFVDVVFPHLQNIRAHEPLFRESNAAPLFQSKEQSSQVFTAGLGAFPPGQGIDSAKSTHSTLAPSEAVFVQ